MQLTKVWKSLRPIEIEELKTDLRTETDLPPLITENLAFEIFGFSGSFKNPSKTSRLISPSQHYISDWFK